MARCVVNPIIFKSKQNIDDQISLNPGFLDFSFRFSFVHALFKGILDKFFKNFNKSIPIVNQRKFLCHKGCANRIPRLKLSAAVLFRTSSRTVYVNAIWMKNASEKRLKCAAFQGGACSMRENVEFARKCQICQRTMQINFPADMTPFIVSPLTCHKHPNTIWISSLFSRFSLSHPNSLHRLASLA